MTLGDTAVRSQNQDGEHSELHFVSTLLAQVVLPPQETMSSEPFSPWLPNQART